MADDLRKGITSAITEGAAAMLDASQGTQFYKQIQDEKKEERARKFALEQLQEEKQKLNNENARRSFTSLVQSFGTRIQSALSVPGNVTAGDAQVLGADAEALVQQVQANPNLSDMDKQIFGTQLNAYLPQLQSIGDSANVNSVANLKGAGDRWTQFAALTPNQQTIASERPQFTLDIARGGDVMMALSNLEPDSISLLNDDQRALADFLKQFPGETFTSLAMNNPDMAQVMLDMSPERIKEKVARAKFISRELPQQKQLTESQFLFNQKDQELFAPLAEINWDEIYSGDNVVVNSEGQYVLSSTPQAAITNAINTITQELDSKSIEELIDMMPNATRLDDTLKTNLSYRINNTLSAKLKSEGTEGLEKLLLKTEEERRALLTELVEKVDEEDYPFTPGLFEGRADHLFRSGPSAEANREKLIALNKMPYSERLRVLSNPKGYFGGANWPMSRNYKLAAEQETTVARQGRKDQIRSTIQGFFIPPPSDNILVQEQLDDYTELKAILSDAKLSTDSADIQIANVAQHSALINPRTFREPFLLFLNNIMQSEFHKNSDANFHDKVIDEFKKLTGTQLSLETGVGIVDLKDTSSSRMERAIKFYMQNADTIAEAQGFTKEGVGSAIAGEVTSDFEALVRELGSMGDEFMEEAMDLLDLEQQTGVLPEVTLALGAML